MEVDATLTEFDDRWLIDYRDMQVIQVRISYQLTLLLDSGATVDIEQEALLTRGSAHGPHSTPVSLVPERQDVAAALDLFGVKILSSVAFKSGHLRLVFDSGHHLSVAPHPQFEAWSVTGPGTLCVVCQPAGGLAVWR